MINTTTRHNFIIDHEKSDSLTGARTLAQGWCYPEKDWFSLSIGKDEKCITWSEWDKLVEAVAELRRISKMKVELTEVEKEERK